MQRPPVRQEIVDAGCRRDEPVLLQFINDGSETDRVRAVRELASFSQLSESGVDRLIQLLKDPSVEVREHVAYAIGQTYREAASPALLRALLAEPTSTTPRGAMLEALGKVADTTALQRIVAEPAVFTPEDKDRASLHLGLLYGALRGVRSTLLDSTVVAALRQPTYPATVAHRTAALYLQRIDVVPGSRATHDLVATLGRTDDPIVAMGLLRALGRTESPEAFAAIGARLRMDGDWRERVEAVAAIRTYPYHQMSSILFNLLTDPHPLVATAAADCLVDRGSATDVPRYLTSARQTGAPAVTARLYRAANRHVDATDLLTTTTIEADLLTDLAASEDLYRTADLLAALGERSSAYPYLIERYRSEPVAAIRTALAEQLTTIANRTADEPDKTMTAALAPVFRQMIESADDGPAYYAALLLGKQADRFRPAYPDPGWIDRALNTYELPRQIETYREVSKARDSLLQEPSVDARGAAADPRHVDWAVLEQYGDREVTLLTTAGNIRLRLLPAEAPATVSSFLDHVTTGYYDGTVFHRVVPNFVAQGGGPRGDGFGSADFVLPTETPGNKFDRAGRVGMASAGRDTEGVQFFITHRPTPHLDGKYTIFGQVVAGQEVVDRLVPGSRIESVRVE